jgi:hypothetical protein
MNQVNQMSKNKSIDHHVEIKWFESFGLSIARDEFLPPYDKHFSHMWTIILLCVRINVTYYTDSIEID